MHIRRVCSTMNRDALEGCECKTTTIVKTLTLHFNRNLFLHSSNIRKLLLLKWFLLTAIRIFNVRTNSTTASDVCVMKCVNIYDIRMKTMCIIMYAIHLKTKKIESKYQFLYAFINVSYSKVLPLVEFIVFVMHFFSSFRTERTTESYCFLSRKAYPLKKKNL